jgi:2-dehydro-3-deoxygalactonokinase
MTHFFSCDWGTTSFRLRRVNAATGEVLALRQEACGIRTLSARCAAGDTAEEVFASFLAEQLRLMAGENTAALDGATVIISGMASSSAGWRELPYARLPLPLDGSGIARDSFALRVDAGSRARIHLISGVRAQADMMRGEETEILGIFADGRHARIADDGLVVLPGTHSKHVRLHHRQLTGFRTYMTGELFDVLSAHSLLRASVRMADGVPCATLSETASRDAFAAGVREASVDGLAGSLFQTRVRTVLQSAPPAVNRWFLSGLLIGSEVADLAARELDAPIMLAAAEPLQAAYGLAFEILGLKNRLTVVPPEEMALASVRGHRVLLALGSTRFATRSQRQRVLEK